MDHGRGVRPRLIGASRVDPTRRGLVVLAGVLGAALLLAGGSWYQALVTPPYRFVDEQAHAGYVLDVQRGRLPTIDSPIDGAHGGTALRNRLAGEPPRRQDVWVANNPPLTYVVAAGPAALTRALGLPGGPLLGLRLVNVVATAGAIALTYLLGRDLAGGDRVVGLVTAGLVAASPHLGFVAALGFNEGLPLLATAGVLWSLARLATLTTTTTTTTTDLGRAVAVLGAWCGVAAATRPMALVAAGVAGLLGLAVTWGRVPLGAALVRLGAPAAILSGWWYALNVARYGDPTGSEVLLDKFERTPVGSLVSVLRDNTIWDSALRTLTTRRTDQRLPGDPVLGYRLAQWLVIASVAATTALLVWSWRRARARARAGRRERSTPVGRGERWLAARFPRPLPGRAWAATTAVALVHVVLTAQHRSGGGNPHPRYLLPGLGVLAAAVALPVVRLPGRAVGRCLGVGLVAALAAIALVQTRASARWLAATPKGPAGSELVAAIGPAWVRGAGLAAAALGLLVLVAAILRTPTDEVRPTR